MASGLALNSLSNHRFGAHHILFFTINSFVGPDIGEFSPWIFKGQLSKGGKQVFDSFHDPFGYMAWSLLLAFLYLCLSYGLAKWKWLKWVKLYSKAPLTYIQCWLLGSAGGLTHFFLDNLFERNSKVFAMVMATGDPNKDVYTVPTCVVSVILSVFFALFFFIYRSPETQLDTPIAATPHQSSPPLAPRSDEDEEGSHQALAPAPPQPTPAATSVPARLYALVKSFLPELWCLKTFLWSSARQLAFWMGWTLVGVATVYVGFLYGYKTHSKNNKSGIGEEADVGVIIFMFIFFFCPHLMCILSMHHA